MKRWEEEWAEEARRLEQQLQQALLRKPPKPDFAEQVLARTRKPKVVVMPRWLASAAAAVVLIAGGSSLAWRRHQGEMAKEQVMQAVRITAGKLHQIQVQVKEARP